MLLNGIYELTASGTSSTVFQSYGIKKSTVFGSSSAHSHQFTGSVYISGVLHAREYKVHTVDVYGGATTFGNDLTDPHQFTGSVHVTGATYLNGTSFIPDNHSLYFGNGRDTNLFWDEAGTGRFRIVGLHSTVDNSAGGTFTVTGGIDLSGSTDIHGSTVLGKLPSHIHQITGSVYMGDDNKLYFGDHVESQIYFDSTGAGLGYLHVSGAYSGLALSGSNIRLDGDIVEVTKFGAAGHALKITPGVGMSPAQMEITGNIVVGDDKSLYFGDHAESQIYYKETDDNFLHISGSTKGIVLSGSSVVIDGALQGASPLNIVGDVTMNANVTLGDAAADVTTVTSQLTASEGLTSTKAAFFNANVTLGNAGVDVTTVTSQLTASQGILVDDDKYLYFGAGADSKIYYKEAADDYLHISGSSKGMVLSGSSIIIDGALEGASPLNIVGGVTIAGDVTMTGPATSVGFGNPATISASLTIPTHYNYNLIGPITVDGGVLLVVSGTANLKIS